MAALARQVYVISDLHLGGVYPDPTHPRDAGFRICTEVRGLAGFVNALARKPRRDPRVELVINGDLVDFLAEKEPHPPHWLPFTLDPDAATRKLEAIAERDREFFAALRHFLDQGHRLVILLGNHDIELTLPPVRRSLAALLGADGGRDYEFLYDGEAYLVGDALIEHGNRYDRFNMVDFDSLRRFRSLLSRKQKILKRHLFDPPPGSKMVATVINPIKEDYAFVDLLKPETGAVMPLLLALEPGYRSHIARAAKLMFDSLRHKLETASLPSFAGDIAAEAPDGDGPEFSADIGMQAPAPMGPAGFGTEGALRDVLGSVLGDESETFLQQVDDAGPGSGASDVSATEVVDRTVGLVRLVLGKAKEHMERRCPLLLRALRALRTDQSFRLDVETAPEYLHAARDLAASDIRYIVFGHTHMAKHVPLDGRGFYLNSGTWANVMEFPKEIVSAPDHEAIPKVREFMQHMADGDFSRWTLSRPTYVRLDVDTTGRVANAELCRYSDPAAL